MPTIDCPECGRDVSTHADACPECGAPLEVNAKAPDVDPEETPPLERLRKTSWGRLAAIYFVAGFIITAFAADVPNENPLAAFIGLFVFLWGVLFYFIPAFVAWKRRHHQTMAIAALNLFAGWTVVGWIGSLIWSLTAVQETAGEAA